VRCYLQFKLSLRDLAPPQIRIKSRHAKKHDAGI
jgi:hypothetical protein